jgi:hypothetical protein
MTGPITATTLSGQGIHVQLNETPDTCPRCHRSIHPKACAAHLTSTKACQAVFQCTHNACQEIFIATYVPLGGASNKLNYGGFTLAPVRARRTPFPDVIFEVSPVFCEIFAQVDQAESMQLDQIVGIGLRKALEFLVKDYASSTNAGKEAEIRGSTLTQCISSYVEDTNVRECAKRAAWLGNDERTIPESGKTRMSPTCTDW